MGLWLDVRDLTVRKGGRTILENVTLSVAPDQFVAIIGANGAGKTTLLRAIAGERPYSGSICIDSKNLYDDPEKWFRQIGQVPTDNVLHESLPVAKALGYVGRLRNVSPSILEDCIHERLKVFSIDHKYHSPIYQLSSGERKKVNICAELLTEPGLLLLDEPTTNLDPDAERELMERLAHLAKQQGTTIVIVSHTVNSLGYCDRVVFMGDSKIVGILTKVPKTENLSGSSNSSGGDNSHDWLWTPTDHEETREKIEHAKFSERIIQKFRDHQTEERKPSSNPSRKSVPCEGIANSSFSSSSQTQPHSTSQDDGTAWDHYRIVVSRQIALLYYEGWRIPVRETWQRILAFLHVNASLKRGKNDRRSILDLNWMVPFSLLFALAVGPLSGILLSLVLPKEALIRSADTAKDLNVDLSNALHAAFLIGLVAFLIGLLGTFREVVREINIYHHERLKGLRAKAYLLAKFSVSGILYGIIAPVLMFAVLRVNQELPPEGLIFGGEHSVLISILLTSLTGVALGLAISCVGTRGELATILMSAWVIINALLSGLSKNVASEKWIGHISTFVSSRWAMEALRTTTGRYCWMFNRMPRDQYSPAHLLAVWVALLAYVLTALVIAYLALHYKDTWFTPLARLKPLVSRGNYVYVVVIGIMVFASLALHRSSMKAYNNDWFVADVDEFQGLEQVIGWFGAARCVRGQAPSPIGEATNELQIFVPTQPPSYRPTSTIASVPSDGRDVQVTPTEVDNTPATNGSVTPPTTSFSTRTPTVNSDPALWPSPTSETLKDPTVQPSPTSTETTEPTVEPSPTNPVPREPTVVVADPVDMYFSPTTQRGKKLVSLPANSTLTLLSQVTYNGAPWLRVQAADEAGRGYVGWVYAANPPLSNHVWKVSLERKTPPDCTIAIASTYLKMEDHNLSAGRLGTWTSDGVGDVAVVVDLYRDEVGVLSDDLTLHLQLNDRDLMPIPIEPQKKRFLLQNGVYKMQVSSGDRLELVLTPSSSHTLSTLRTHISIFFVPKDCEFGEG